MWSRTVGSVCSSYAHICHLAIATSSDEFLKVLHLNIAHVSGL